ncbi:MAG: apolipoprotein N-acyltransferase [Saprospiraceae bacterium]|nr:apolipoprotein N-acyltransferase [Saprospiraceae bacterium]MCF8248433.1 apolipoprotein N-acyltransferase [Saprospiraceae bacterium]MCF8309961.1 apolipoprotein N-acyltransferase [Saprospiraceae bacterium]MCF8438708.1 apolipoprotein N-acyltransferase [Saprospiraceae bacterium]
MNNKTRLILLAATSIATLAVGYNMYSLWQEETLWGHRPLFFFVLAWASIVLLFWKRYTRHPKGLRWLGLSTLSGVLLAVSFPPFPTTILLFIAWVPLLIVEYEIAKERAVENRQPSTVNRQPRLLPYVYHSFVLWNILVTWWVGNTAFIAGIVAIWLNSWFMFVPFIFFHWTKKYLPKTGYLSFVVFWISFEFLHLNWEISWSWLTLGNAFAEFPQAVQWYEYTGVFGGTLWVLAANVLTFKLLKKCEFRISPKLVWTQHRWPLLQIKLLVLVPIAISLVWYFNQKDVGRDEEVVVVQPNFEPHYEKFRIPKQEQLKTFLRLSEEAITEKTQYLVWPETSFGAGETDGFDSNPTIRYVNTFLEKYPKVKLVVGVDAYKIFKDGEQHTNHTRREERGNEVFFWEAYNAAIQLQAGADSIPFYIKSKLVPGAEILPYHKYLFFLKPIVDKLDGSVEGLGNQPNREAFPSESGKVAPSICYESVFGDYNCGYVRAGAEATFIMTNDGWWDNTAGHKQHLAFARLRAIETRRSIARSANTGTSCFINQRGDVQQPTDYGVEAAILQNIKFNRGITFYVKWGDMIARFAVLVTGLLLLNLLVQKLKRRMAK